MGDQKEDQQHKHPQEQLLEAVVVNCQHIAAICKGLCVRGVSHDVSVKELERHKELNESDSLRILKEECVRCQTVLSDCVVNLDKLKRQYLAEYNKNEESETKPDDDSEKTEAPTTDAPTTDETPLIPETKVANKKGKKVTP
jgi:hypothetical protein